MPLYSNQNTHYLFHKQTNVYSLNEQTFWKTPIIWLTWIKQTLPFPSKFERAWKYVTANWLSEDSVSSEKCEKNPNSWFTAIEENLFDWFLSQSWVSEKTLGLWFFLWKREGKFWGTTVWTNNYHLPNKVLRGSQSLDPSFGYYQCPD